MSASTSPISNSATCAAVLPGSVSLISKHTTVDGARCPADLPIDLEAIENARERRSMEPEAVPDLPRRTSWFVEHGRKYERFDRSLLVLTGGEVEPSYDRVIPRVEPANHAGIYGAEPPRWPPIFRRVFECHGCGAIVSESGARAIYPRSALDFGLRRRRTSRKRKWLSNPVRIRTTWRDRPRAALRWYHRCGPSRDGIGPVRRGMRRANALETE